MISLRRYSSCKQRGAAAVEFALVAMIFFMLLLGIIEMGRVLFTWNSAVEATRYGARVAAVCDMNDTAVVGRMQRIMPHIVAGNVNVTYLPSGCNKSNCQWVRVAITGFQITPHIPVLGETLGVLSLPPFSTTLPRESLESTNSDGDVNPLCT